MAEAERLAYVAVTRAERHLVLFSAGEANPSGNPLDPWLDARAGDDDPRISLHHPRSIPPDLRWSPSNNPSRFSADRYRRKPGSLLGTQQLLSMDC